VQTSSAAVRWSLAAIVAAFALLGAGCGSREPGELELGAVGRVVPAGFVGFSIEYRTLGGFMGLPDNPPNPLLADVWAAGGATVRVGGNSADRSWPAGWPGPPSTVRYPVTGDWWERLGGTLRASGTHVELTMNLAARRPDAAAEMLRRADAALPAGAVTGVEVGNEPDLYSQERWRDANGKPTGLRRAPYTFEDFLAEQRAVVSDLRASGLPFSLIGPGFGSFSWRQRARSYLDAHVGVSRYASHDYPLSNCRDKGAKLVPADLLRASVVATSVRSLKPELSAARAAGLPLLVQEANSIACRGKAGVSDHPYSALWAADELFTLADAGVDGYAFHASDSAYDPFAFRRSGRSWQVHLAPEYLGILLFQRVTGNGGRLRAVTGAPAGVSTWAARDAAGTTRVLLINRSTTAPARAAVAGSRARLLQVTTAGGLRVGGHAWPQWQDDARVDLGRYERPLAGKDGRLTISLPAASAAVLTMG